MLQEVLWHAGLEELHSHRKVFSHLVAKIKPLVQPGQGEEHSLGSAGCSLARQQPCWAG